MMNNTKKIILITVLILLGLIGFYQLGKLFSPGSYPNAERYTLEQNESNVIKVIEKFKMSNPKFIISQEVGLKDGRRNKDDYWYHFYFYYKETNEIVKFWVREDYYNKTTLAFVAVNKGLINRNWKLINQDFTRKENRAQKEKFEETILKPVERILKELK